jgi:hypothetical protein
VAARRPEAVSGLACAVVVVVAVMVCLVAAAFAYGDAIGGGGLVDRG